MTQITLVHRLDELTELERYIEQLKVEAEAIKSIIKDEMTARDVEQLVVGDYVVRFTSCLTQRFDTKRFKEEMGTEIYKRFTREVESKRFSISH